MEPASAAVSSEFRAGNIISDALFFNGSAMTADDVQAFLVSKRPVCDPGFTCLKDYRTATNERPAEPGLCAGYPAAGPQSAAQIIALVGVSCGVSQAALLVLLQKEQSLVTARAPSELMDYRSATGFRCPDGAPCDPLYSGFFNQVFHAARQFKRYARDTQSFRHQANSWNTVLFHPDAACGSANVFVENQATAGLYNYTPYQPDQAALANLYGTGGDCSAYGNRNFWRQYTDWFGSTQVGSNLVRTATDPTVYLITHDRKFAIDSLATFSALDVLGDVGYVSQAFLNSKVVGTALGRFIRGRNGLIYLFDDGVRYPVANCEQLATFGRSCADYGAMELADGQIASFELGPQLTSTVTTTNGKTFVIASGTRLEAASAGALVAVGAAAPVTLSEEAIASLPHGPPIFVGSVVAVDRGSGARSVLASGTRYPVARDLVEESVLGGALPPVALDGAGLQLLPAGDSLTGVLGRADGSRYVLTPNGKRALGSGFALALPVTVVPDTLLDALADVADPAGPFFLKAAGARTVYVIEGGRTRAIDQHATLISLLAPANPFIYAVAGSAEVAALATGVAVLAPGSVVKGVSSPELFLVDGLGERVPVPSMSMVGRYGLGSWSTVDEGVLAGYAVSSPALSSAVTCGGERFVVVNGALVAVGAGFGLSFRSLSVSSCSVLARSAVGIAGSLFVKGVSSPTVYVVQGGIKRAVPSMAAVAALNVGNPSLVFVTMDDAEVAALA